MTAITTSLVFVVVRTKRSGRPAVPDQDPANDSGPSSEPPALPALPTLSRRPRGTPREQRQSELGERARSGLCLYCESRATRPSPQLVIHTIGWLDRILRRLRVVTFDRPRLEVDGGSFDLSLCEDHHFLERARVERKIAQRAMRVADLVLEEREDIYEFMRHGLDEEMSSRADEVRRSPPTKTSSLHLVSGNLNGNTPSGTGG